MREWGEEEGIGIGSCESKNGNFTQLISKRNKLLCKTENLKLQKVKKV